MEELVGWLVAIFAVLIALVFGIKGLAWVYTNEKHYLLIVASIITIIIGVLIIKLFWFLPSGSTSADTGTLSAQASRAEDALREARHTLEREAASLERLRLEKRSEIHYEILRQRHHESRTIADKWYANTRNTRKIRRSVSAGLTQVREKKRTLAKMRDSAPQDRRSGIVLELRETQQTIDQIYGALSSLDEEIEKGRRGLNEYNRQTGELRDHIRDHCGVKGRLWFEKLEARKHKRKLIDN